MTRCMRRTHAMRTLRAICSIAFAGFPTILQKIKLGSMTVKTYRLKVMASPPAARPAAASSGLPL